MGEAKRRKDRGDYPARTVEKPERPKGPRAPGAWLGRRLHSGAVVEFPDGTRYSVTDNGFRRLVVRNGAWVVRVKPTGSARQRRKARQRRRMQSRQ